MLLKKLAILKGMILGVPVYIGYARIQAIYARIRQFLRQYLIELHENKRSNRMSISYQKIILADFHNRREPSLVAKLCSILLGYNMRIRLVPGPNLGLAATNRNLRLYPEVCFSCIVKNLHLSVI